MNEEIKVVIALKENRGSIGVQSPNCDPLFVTFEGELEVALEKVPGLVAEARQRWEENPRYPKCESPLPSQTQPAQPAQRPTRQAASTAQPSMF
jgi:hypothetical protein